MKGKVFAVLFVFAFVDFPFSQEAKNALLIANGIYGKDLGALMQPEREAEALKVALESIGFKEQLIKTRVLSATLQDYCQQRFKTGQAGRDITYNVKGVSFTMKRINSAHR